MLLTLIVAVARTVTVAPTVRTRLMKVLCQTRPQKNENSGVFSALLISLLGVRYVSFKFWRFVV